MTQWCRNCEPGADCRECARKRTGKPMLRVWCDNGGRLVWRIETGKGLMRRFYFAPFLPLGELIQIGEEVRR